MFYAPLLLLTFDQLFVQFMALAGVATLIAAIVNALKTIHLLNDGDAPKASLALNVGAFVVLVALSVFKPDLEVSQLDATAATIAQVLTLVLGFAVQFGLTKGMHGLLKGAPVIGKSFTPKLVTREIPSDIFRSRQDK